MKYIADSNSILSIKERTLLHCIKYDKCIFDEIHLVSFSVLLYMEDCLNNRKFTINLIKFEEIK